MADGDDAYGGILGAFPYAIRTSDSWVFKCYGVVGGLLAALVVVMFALALVALLGVTASSGGGTFTFSRAFFIVVMLSVVGPLVAPVLLVARRHRRSSSGKAYDAAIGGAGFGFLFAVYLGLVISTPTADQSTVSGPLAPVVTTLYDLPQLAGFVPPICAVVVLWIVHRWLTRPTGDADSDSEVGAA